jgi:single-stranded DNA-specific DHH superfamily exonuclease
VQELFEFLCAAKKPKDVFESKFFVLKKEFDAQLEMEAERFKKDAECIDSLEVCFFETHNKLPSVLSNLLSSMTMDKTMVIFERRPGTVKCSFRRGDFKVNCGELAAFAVAKSPGAKGGGHVPAAAASFPSEYFSTFKERVKEYLGKHSSKNYKK